METHTTEEQQLAAIRDWLKENGSSIVIGVIFGFAALFGIKAWQGWQENQAQQASDLYTGMITALQSGEKQLVVDRAGALIADHARSGYAAMAALAVAKVRIEDGELEAARSQLQWVLDNSSVGYIRDTARLRLARVLLALDDPDGAEKLLDQTGAGAAPAGAFAELRGDIQLQRGELQLAARSYQEALDLTGDEYSGRQLLQYKLDNISGAAGSADASTAAQAAAVPEPPGAATGVEGTQ